MFKKTLLAMAVASVSANVLAADIDASTTPDTISFEGAASETNIGLPATNIVVALGAEYTTGDVFTLTFSGATVDTAATTVAAVYADNTAGGNTDDSMTLGVLSTTADTVTVRVTAVTDGGVDGVTTTNGEITVSGINFDTDSVLANASNTVSVAYAAQTAQGLNLDTGGDLTADILEVASQFTNDITTAFDGTIDVAQLRKGFSGNAQTDAAVFELDNATTGNFDATIAAGNLTVDYTVSGSLSYLNDTVLDDDTDGEVELAELNVAVQVGGGTLTAVAEDFSSITVSVDDGDETPDTVTLTLDTDDDSDGAGDLVLETTDFTLSTEVNYNDAQGNADSTTLANSSLGSWGINGTIAHVPFFVNDSLHATVVTVANYSDQMPDVELVIYDGTEAISSGVVGQAAANGVTNITAWVKAAADAAGVTSYAFDVVVNEQSTNIDVNAQYVRKTTGSRAVINVVE